MLRYRSGYDCMRCAVDFFNLSVCLLSGFSNSALQFVCLLVWLFTFGHTMAIHQTMPSRTCVIQEYRYYTIRKSLYEALQDIVYIQLPYVVDFGISFRSL